MIKFYKLGIDTAKEKYFLATANGIVHYLDSVDEDDIDEEARDYLEHTYPDIKWIHGGEK